MSSGRLRSRTGLIAVAGGVAGEVALAIGAAWSFVLRDTTEPVSVDDVITTFREGEEAAPATASPVPDGTDDWIAWAVGGMRLDSGLGVLYNTEPIAKAAKLLRNGEAVLVLGEYAKPSMRTYPMRLLDGVAELPAGPAALARLCGSPIVLFTVLPLAPRRWRVEIEPPLDPPSRNGGVKAEQLLLQELADSWTVSLRAHTEHWAAVYPLTWRT